tara:strand:- start:8339 stop:8782 length:444 start_codon:yes stop_codon:yes gene_type:complete
MFAVHGDWQILVKDNYVLQWFSGCWNEEAAIQYSQEFQDKTQGLKGTQWAIVSFFDDWELGVPEMESHLIEHCQRFKDNGCIKDCHIYSPSVFKSMQLENIVPQSEGTYERRVFVEVADAILWMASCHFTIETSEFLNALPKAQQAR